MSDTTLRYYGSTIAFMQEQPKRRAAHARTMLRLHTSRRRFKQSIRSVLAKVY